VSSDVAPEAKKPVRLLQTAALALRRWRELPPEHRARLADEAREVIAASGDFRHAAADGLRAKRGRKRHKRWIQQREEALRPPPEFRLAQQLVASLERMGETEVETLAHVLGADGSSDRTFRRGLQIAHRARLVTKERLEGREVVSPVGEDEILSGNFSLKETGFLDDLALRITQVAMEQGIVDARDLAAAVGERGGSPAFRAALLRARTNGELEWLTPTCFGVSQDHLEQFDKEYDPGAGAIGGPSLPHALRRLTLAVAALRVALVESEAVSPRPKALRTALPPASDVSRAVTVGDRVRAGLDRFMSSATPSEMRETVREVPELHDDAVLRWMREASRRARQSGDVDSAERLEFWHDSLRRFVEYGVDDGYLEMAVEWVTRGDSAANLAAFPELRESDGQQYLRRRLEESFALKDADAVQRYSLVMHMATVPAENIDVAQLDDNLVNDFLAEFFNGDRPDQLEGFLRQNPSALAEPQTYAVETLLVMAIEQARADLELVRLRDLLIRRWLLRRSRKVGVAAAFAEHAQGVRWHDEPEWQGIASNTSN
jgi:hypothetical protein